MDTGLDKQTVLVTGASGGIGGAIARSFAREEAQLALHGFSNMEEVMNLKEQLEVPVLPVRADLTSEDETRNMFDEVVRKYNSLDVLVANAGIWPSEDSLITDISLERWNETIDTDLTSVFLCAREFFRVLKGSGTDAASMVIIGSTAALFGEAGHADYSASKAAITYGLTRSLKNEIVQIAPKGRVNAVCPGWTDTPMSEESLEDPENLRKTFQTRPLNEIAQPEDIAPAVVYLSSDKLAGHITGEILTVAGGMEGRMLGGVNNDDY